MPYTNSNTKKVLELSEIPCALKLKSTSKLSYYAAPINPGQQKGKRRKYPKRVLSVEKPQITPIPLKTKGTRKISKRRKTLSIIKLPKGVCPELTLKSSPNSLLFSKNKAASYRKNLSNISIGRGRKKYVSNLNIEAQEIWDFWNSQNNLRTHKTPNSKLGKTFSKNIHRILHGKFFFKKMYIPKRYYGRKFSIDDVKKAISRYNYLLEMGNGLSINPSARKAIKSTGVNTFFYREFFVPTIYSDDDFSYMRILSPLLYFIENSPAETSMGLCKLKKTIPEWVLKNVMHTFNKGMLFNNHDEIKKGTLSYSKLIKCINTVYPKLPTDKNGSIMPQLESSFSGILFRSFTSYCKGEISEIDSNLFMIKLLPQYMYGNGYINEEQLKFWKLNI